MSVVAVDFGGTRIKAGLVTDGVTESVRVVQVPEHRSLERILPDLAKWFAEMADDAGGQVDALVWALPCIIGPDQASVVRTFGKYEDAPGLDFIRWAREVLGWPLLLENDARAAALGEWQYGAGRGCGNLVMMTLGTGIGTAVICDGQPLRGSNGVAGNLGGHCVTHAGGRKCVCGLRGCAEAHVATWALPALARESPWFGESRLSDGGVIDYAAVFRHAAGGDRLALELQERALDEWEVVLTNLVQQYDPDRVVLGGGIMAADKEILTPLQKRLDDYGASREIRVELRRAELGDAAALAGCAWLWESKKSTENFV